MTRSGDLFDFETTWQVASDIDGWLLEAQARALYDAARAVPAGRAIVEIGSHRGKSTVVLARGKPDSVPLTAVDPFEDSRWGGGSESLRYFLANLDVAGVSDKVTFYRGISKDAAASWSGPQIGLIWIDGAHDRSSVLADIDSWLPHLADGARLYIHDAFSAVGTTEAILTRLLVTKKARFLGSVRTLAMFERQDASLVEAAASTARVVGRLPFFAQNLSIKVAQRRGWPWALKLLGYDETTGVI